MNITTLIKAGTAAALLLALAGCALLWSLLDAERAARLAERNAGEVRETVCRANERLAEQGLTALRQEFSDLDAAFALYRTREREREEIMRRSATRQRNPEERERIIDDETRKHAAAFLNDW